ncbi:beta-ketoacyl synthase N-terminal-like domain-containing protein [Nocardia sp. NPDC020380]|uniref:beta-ketoacyl synthase N-terminal-like domain-containing protein n=1 Tax=Nocardia sp. NPDC020380 TaxID=3364309 RepID=UPI0037A660F1
MSGNALITYTETATAAAPDLAALWRGLMALTVPEAATIPGVGSDADYRAFTVSDNRIGYETRYADIVAAALGPILPRIRAAARDARRGRPVVLVSTVMGSRPQYDRLGADAAGEAISEALAADVATVSALLDDAADVLGIGSGCAAGTTAIGIGRGLVTSGRADFVVCLGAEMISLEVLTLFTALGGLARDGVVRPFDEHRSGMLPGEGWGVLVLESQRWAQEPVARVLGYGEASDGYDIAAPSPDGIGLTAAIGQALDESRCRIDDLGWVCAHGTGTRANDALEARIYDRLFGERTQPLPCVSLKGMTGHCQGAAGVIEAAVACTSLVEGIVPPNAATRTIDPVVAALERIRVPLTPGAFGASPAGGPRVLSTSFGFGGSVSAVVLGRP